MTLQVTTTITVLNIITDAMDIVGAVDMDESPTAQELAVGLRRLNMMMGHWSAQNIMASGTILENFPLVAGQLSYTIGTGGNFNTAKPTSITDAYIRDNIGDDTQVNIITEDQYASIPDKSITQARPDTLYYDPGLTQQATQMGTIFLYSIPDSSVPYTLFIRSHKDLLFFGSVTDQITMHSAYYEALVNNLAKRLWRVFHKGSEAVPQDIIVDARNTKHVVQAMNFKRITSVLEVPGGKKQGDAYNIYTGAYN